MKKGRRNFIKHAGLFAAGTILLPQIAISYGQSSAAALSKLADHMSGSGTPSLDKFGIQLYTLRDVFPEEPKRTLKQLAGFGYQQIEGYEGPQGMFWGMGNKGFKSYLDDIGLTMISSHVNIHKDFEVKAGQAAEIGMKYLICPYIGPQKSVEDWKKVKDKFNACGEICRKNGIRFAYHNHAYSFKAFSGMIPHDFMMDNTDPELVDHEMDIYWVVTGGADPIDYLTRYPNRFKLCHVKDRMKNAGDEREASCDLGTGIIDFSKILNVASKNGMEYFILEQERYDNSTPILSAQKGANYLKQLEFS